MRSRSQAPPANLVSSNTDLVVAGGTVGSRFAGVGHALSITVTMWLMPERSCWLCEVLPPQRPGSQKASEGLQMPTVI